MKTPTNQPFRRLLKTTGVLVAASALVVGCTSNEPEEEADAGAGGDSTEAPAGGNDEPGETVTIGFSGPAADHGWLAAINSSAQEEAAKYEDIDFRGLEFSRERWEESMHVDRDDWFLEIASHNELFFKVYDRLPRDLTAIRDLLLAALCRMPAEAAD